MASPVCECRRSQLVWLKAVQHLVEPGDGRGIALARAGDGESERVELLADEKVRQLSALSAARLLYGLAVAVGDQRRRAPVDGEPMHCSLHFLSPRVAP